MSAKSHGGINRKNTTVTDRVGDTIQHLLPSYRPSEVAAKEDTEAVMARHREEFRTEILKMKSCLTE